MRVQDLVPGMQIPHRGPYIGLGSEVATFVARVDEHPVWPNLALVIWRMPDGWPSGVWSHDALSPAQDVGEPLPSTVEERQRNLRAALLGAP